MLVARDEGRAGPLVAMLRAVVEARRHRYLMLNAPESALPGDRRAVAPRAPSVLPLAEPGMVAVHALVPAAGRLAAAARTRGGSARSSILIVPVERMARMRALARPRFAPYAWAPPTDEVARLAGHRPVAGAAVRPEHAAAPAPSTRPGAVAGALARDQRLSRAAGIATLRRAIADYAGVEPENVVLGAGADDLILLVRSRVRRARGTRSRSPRPDLSALPHRRRPGRRRGRRRRGRCSRSPAGRTTRPATLGELPEARPLVVDEAYFEFSGETAVPLLDDGVIVLRTFSKLFALAGARVGYALAATEVAAELNARQAPAPDLDALGRACGCCARGPAGRAAGDRGARAFRGWPTRSRLAATGVARRTSSTSRGSTGRRWRPRSSVRASSCAAIPRRFACRCATARTTTYWSRRSPGCSTGPLPLRQAATGAHECFARRPRRGSPSGSHSMVPRRVRVATGTGMYDHLLEQLAFHAGFDLVLEGAGDLETGSHHRAEDAALALGQALDDALGDRRGIARYGDAVVPMDDALARAAVDLGGRPQAELQPRARSRLAVTCSPAWPRRGALRSTSRQRVVTTHHVAEAAFKAVGASVARRGARGGNGMPSTKGSVVNVAICGYGAGQRALGRDGVPPPRRRHRRPTRHAADLAVLPGVGSAAAAMGGLRERGLRRRAP